MHLPSFASQSQNAAYGVYVGIPIITLLLFMDARMMINSPALDRPWRLWGAITPWTAVIRLLVAPLLVMWIHDALWIAGVQLTGSSLRFMAVVGIPLVWFAVTTFWVVLKRRYVVAYGERL